MDGFGDSNARRMSPFNPNHDVAAQNPPAPLAIGHRPPRRKDPQHPKPPLTPSASSMSQPMPNPLLPSAPASPPTPAPSPTPHQLSPTTWQLTSLDDPDEPILDDARRVFAKLKPSAKAEWLSSLVELCDNQTLSFLHTIVSPKLKKDPFTVLPNELCWKILEYVDDPLTFARASSVSKRWHEIMSDDHAWKILCEKHAYRRMSNHSIGSDLVKTVSAKSQQLRPGSPPRRNPFGVLDTTDVSGDRRTSGGRPTRTESKTKAVTHRSHFKHRYIVESAWKKGGLMTARHITPDQGVVTSLHLTEKYIVVALDNANIHIFNTAGTQLRTLSGHHMGVWAMVPWDDILVSGGCDRDVRVWNMSTGTNTFVLRGHTSTVRCLKMSNARTAISGSRDNCLRVWDLENGRCSNVLIGHQASVRCLEIYGDLVVSGSYDTTAKIWNINTGQCLRTLQGHFSQIYAIAFDGQRIATGSLDTSVRIWSPKDGTCLAILQGHTSLVGQLQMRNNTLVTGGSDGSVRVWSLQTYGPIHRLAAHDNSVTSLQFDDSRIVSGGSDGRVKIWDTHTGALIRELSQPAESVWRVAFESERCVVMASRGGRTIMEVWDFTPPAEDEELGGGGASSTGSTPAAAASRIVRDADDTGSVERRAARGLSISPSPSGKHLVEPLEEQQRSRSGGRGRSRPFQSQTQTMPSDQEMNTSGSGNGSVSREAVNDPDMMDLVFGSADDDADGGGHSASESSTRQAQQQRQQRHVRHHLAGTGADTGKIDDDEDDEDDDDSTLPDVMSE